MLARRRSRQQSTWNTIPDELSESESLEIEESTDEDEEGKRTKGKAKRRVRRALDEPKSENDQDQDGDDGKALAALSPVDPVSTPGTAPLTATTEAPSRPSSSRQDSPDSSPAPCSDLARDGHDADRDADDTTIGVGVAVEVCGGEGTSQREAELRGGGAAGQAEAIVSLGGEVDTSQNEHWVLPAWELPQQTQETTEGRQRSSRSQPRSTSDGEAPTTVANDAKKDRKDKKHKKDKKHRRSHSDGDYSTLGDPRFEPVALVADGDPPALDNAAAGATAPPAIAAEEGGAKTAGALPVPAGATPRRGCSVTLSVTEAVMYGRPQDGEEPRLSRLSVGHRFSRSSVSLAMRRKSHGPGFPLCFASCPIMSAVVFFIGMLAFVGAFWRGLTVDTNFDSFMQADGDASEVRTAFVASLPFRGLAARSRRLEDTVLNVQSRLQLLYRSKDGSGLLTERALHDMQEFESKMRSLPGWREQCKERTNSLMLKGCDVGWALPNLVWPSRNAGNSTGQPTQDMTFKLDGQGTVFPLDAALCIAEIKDIASAAFPTGYKKADNPQVLRSIFDFNVGCCKASDADRSAKLMKCRSKLKELMTGELYNYLKDNRLKHTHFNIYWSSPMMNEFEAFAALRDDSYLAVASVLFVVLYIAVYAGSMTISLTSMFLVILSLPVSFVMFSVVSSSNSLGGASFLSLFLVVGVGADVVLVFIAFWNSSTMTIPDEDYPKRIAFVYRYAGIACFITSATTAASFFSNLCSVLLALRQFGFFMGFCVGCVFLNLLVGFPAIAVARSRCGRPCLSRCTRNSDGKKKRVSRFCTSRFYISLYVSKMLVPCRVMFLVVSIALPVGLSFWVMTGLKVDAGMPTMFPKGHNQRERADVEQQFTKKPDLDWSKPEATVCELDQFPRAGNRSRCDLHWCNVGVYDGGLDFIGEVFGNGSATCLCKPSEQTSSKCYNNATRLSVYTRIVGLDGVAPEFWNSPFWKQHLHDVARRSNKAEVIFDRPATLASYVKTAAKIVQEHWETGWVRTTDLVEAPIATLQVSQKNTLCNIQEVCYCGRPSCQFFGQPLVDRGPPRSSWSTVQIPRPSLRRLEAAANGLDVSMVWGIASVPAPNMLADASDTETWRYDDGHSPESPAVQRHLLAACATEGFSDRLGISVRICWIEQFKKWVTSVKGQLFPLRPASFNDFVIEWARQGFLTSTGVPVEDMLWFDTSRTKLVASMLEFLLVLPRKSSDTERILKYLSEWNEFMAYSNAEAPTGAQKGFQTSGAWTQAEAATEIVSSTVNSLVFSIVGGFVGAIFCTSGDIVLAMFVVLAVMAVTVCMVWFIAVVLGWPLGPVEVLGLIIFIGYSVTYSLHIVHKYREYIMLTIGDDLTKRERRQQAVKGTLKDMTGALFGSAVTTLGSTIPLFFCTITIFVKIATLLFAVTVFSMAYAMNGLPAALLCFGPVPCCRTSGGAGWGDRIQTMANEVSRWLADDDMERELAQEQSSQPSPPGEEEALPQPPLTAMHAPVPGRAFAPMLSDVRMRPVAVRTQGFDCSEGSICEGHLPTSRPNSSFSPASPCSATGLLATARSSPSVEDGSLMWSARPDSPTSPTSRSMNSEVFRAPPRGFSAPPVPWAGRPPVHAAAEDEVPGEHFTLPSPQGRAGGLLARRGASGAPMALPAAPSPAPRSPRLGPVSAVTAAGPAPQQGTASPRAPQTLPSRPQLRAARQLEAEHSKPHDRTTFL